MIKAKDISYEYNNGSNKQVILSKESFEIKKGDFVAITGPSGSGKTTLLKILSGILQPLEGKIYWEENDIYTLNKNKLSDLRLRKTGFVYQDFMLIDELNVYDNIILPQKLLNKDNKPIIDKIINDVKINHLLKKYPKQLSGGEKQRVAIARSLVNDPEILFCDEPTGQLDYIATKEIMELLKKLNEDYNLTVVLVTHEIENLKYVNRQIAYHNGKLECD